jgi:hypothetical protein
MTIDVDGKNFKTCVCQRGYLAIPFYESDFLQFQSLDPAAYDVYLNAYVINLPLDGFNPSRDLGFWCVICPLGADCTAEGTNISTVMAISGYFEGIDGSGTTFLPCLNDACSGNGLCAQGYTGIAWLLFIVCSFSLFLLYVAKTIRRSVRGRTSLN